MCRCQIGLIVLGLIGFFCIPANMGYDGGLIFYDPATNHKLLPPIVTSTKFGAGLRMPFIGQPCTCQTNECGCCVGMKVDVLDFDQKMCANVSYNVRDLEMEMNIFVNRKKLIMYKLSAHNPPPFCIPVPLPIPVNLCMKVHDIQTMGTNIHLCMDWIVKVLSNDIFVLHFTCMNIGTDGIHTINPNEEQMQSLGGADVDGQVNSHIFDQVDFDKRRS